MCIPNRLIAINHAAAKKQWKKTKSSWKLNIWKSAERLENKIKDISQK